MLDLRTSHAEDEVLEAYVRSALSRRRASELEGHLLVCAGCQERLTETEIFVRTFQTALLKLCVEPRRRVKARPQMLRAGAG